MLKLGLLLAIFCVVGAVDDYAFGTYYKLFNAQSLWNCKPVNPVFAPNVSVPTSYYYPDISSGAYSTGVFLATAADPPMTVYGVNGSQINNVDNLSGIPNITLPHWPADSVPATGRDGHCDIADNTTNILHSFWQLRQENSTGKWVCAQYAWAPLDGYGFGTPDHYYQGARAAGVPTSAGVIRIHEVDDGQPMYMHALAMSMTYTGLSKNPTYIYPATASDWNAQYSNSGQIPEGALMMLPKDFNISLISSPVLLKVVYTLMVYGAYVVDRNDGTPYEIYVEIGANFTMSNKTGWDPVLGDQLQEIRAALQMVQSVSYFLDGNGQVLQPYKNVNLLSMRGDSDAWERVEGDSVATFDTWSQSLLFTNTTKNTMYQNWSGLGYNRVNWADFKSNTNYTFFVQATEGVYIGIAIQFNQTSSGSVFKATLGNGTSATFLWPEQQPYMIVYAFKNVGPAGSGRGLIMETSNMVPPYTI